jgi:uncharacterized membrane protein YgaE (UPF0421/DUF939 family)
MPVASKASGRRRRLKRMRSARFLAPGALRAAALPLLEAGTAAGLSWYLVDDLLGHKRGIFAPIAALYVLSRGPGSRTRRVLETVVGSAVGVAVGDLLIAAIGSGPIQVGVVATLAMAAATALGAPAPVVVQAGTASVLIATIQPPHGLYSALAAQRFVDVLVGGGVGLALWLLLPRDPLRAVRAASRPLFAEVATVLAGIADALELQDAEAGEQMLVSARALDARVLRLEQTVELAAETARLAPGQRRSRATVARQAASVRQLELAVRNIRVLARAALRVSELEPSTPADLVAALHELAAAFAALERAFNSGEGAEEARRRALAAAGRATLVVEHGGSMPLGAVVAQVRSTVTDILQALGSSRAEAVELVRGALDALSSGEAAGSDGDRG